MESVKLKLMNQLNQDDSAIKAIMLNDGFRTVKYREKTMFTIKDHDLLLNVETVDDERGVFQVQFQKLSEVSENIILPFYNDLNLFDCGEGVQYAKEDIRFEGDDLILKFEYFILKMSDYLFSIDEASVSYDEIRFNLYSNTFYDKSTAQDFLNIWKSTRSMGFCKYVDLYLGQSFFNEAINHPRMSHEVLYFLRRAKPNMSYSTGQFILSELLKFQNE